MPEGDFKMFELDKVSTRIKMLFILNKYVRLSQCVGVTDGFFIQKSHVGFESTKKNFSGKQ